VTEKDMSFGRQHPSNMAYCQNPWPLIYIWTKLCSSGWCD